jgi:hypothetical protein
MRIFDKSPHTSGVARHTMREPQCFDTHTYTHTQAFNHDNTQGLDGHIEDEITLGKSLPPLPAAPPPEEPSVVLYFPTKFDPATAPPDAVQQAGGMDNLMEQVHNMDIEYIFLKESLGVDELIASQFGFSVCVYVCVCVCVVLAGKTCDYTCKDVFVCKVAGIVCICVCVCVLHVNENMCV